MNADLIQQKVTEIAKAIGTVKCELHSEMRTHDSIAEVLRSATIPFEREARIRATGRLDFLCDGGIAIEVKLDGARKSIYRQVERYAQEDCVKAIVVATAMALRMPPEINGKPIVVVSLSKAWL